MWRLPARRIGELMYFSSPSEAAAGFAEQNASRGSKFLDCTAGPAVPEQVSHRTARQNEPLLPRTWRPRPPGPTGI